MSEIWTRDAKQTLDHAGENRATGSNVAGNKRGLDIKSFSDAHIYYLAELLIKGSCPLVNYNEIQKSVTDTSTMTLEFIYDNQTQFFIDVTNMNSATENIVFRTSFNLSLEQGDTLLLESGDNLLTEGAS